MIDLPVSKGGLSAFEVARQAALEAGEIIMANLDSEKCISYKEGRNNVVTNVDILAEDKIKSILQKEYPDFGIMTEESAEIVSDTPYIWIVDPIDGTRNYTYGIPHFCVSIALAQHEQVVLGVIWDPVRNELFHAEQGCGAFLNGSPIAVSNRKSLKESLASFDMGYDAEIGKKILEGASAMWPGVVSVRVMGSAALGIAYVACGRVDLYIHLNLYPWDMSSGMLLVEEAGGAVTEVNGNHIGIHSTNIVATNKAIHEDFMNRLMDGNKS